MFLPEVKVLSDHLPFTSLIQTNKGASIRLLTFNMMNKMTFIENQHNYKWSYLNNGVGCFSESSEAYKARLSLVAARINAWIKLSKNSNESLMIALQEGPLNQGEEKELDYFLSLLDKNFKIYSLDKYSNSIITLHDSMYGFSLDLTEKINQVVLTQGFNNRILGSVLIHKKTQEPVLLVNVHASYKFPIIEDIQVLSSKAKELGIEHIIFSGDHNRNLTQTDNDNAQSDISTGKEILSAHGLTAYNIQNASFVAKLDSDSLVKGTPPTTAKLLPAKIETRDGTISTHPVTLRLEPEIYQVFSSHLEYNHLNDVLTNVPAAFLKRINDSDQLVELKQVNNEPDNSIEKLEFKMLA